MKVYLDDIRIPTSDWVRARWPIDVIKLLKTGLVTEISLDHDLGNDNRGTGYDVLLWIEEAVANTSFIPPKITIHTSNTSAYQKMEAAVNKINSLSREKYYEY
jgi:hypothetical protein